MVDELLKKYGVTYEQLTADELETLNQWLTVINQGVLTIDKVREFINSLRDATEMELTKHDLDSKQDLFLKARLKNLMLLDTFLTSPEKAKQHLERAVANIAGGVG